MKDNRNDGAIERSYTQKWRFLIAERQLVKANERPKFRFVLRTPRRGSCVRSRGSTCCTPTRRVRIRVWGCKTPLQAMQDLSTNYLTSTGMTLR